jgi:peptidoglycan/LPS O-acetylase OafA/YrhL
MASSERRMRTAGLDGLRAVAALSVLCLHVWLYTLPNPDRPTRDGFLEYAVWELRLGLVFFFVLSGYLLYRAFAAAALRRAAPVDLAHYARRRVARIVPAYYLAVAGSIALLWGADGTPGVRLPDASALPLFFVFGENYSSETFMQLNPVMWTLCLEAAFYLSLPLIGWAAYRFGHGRPRAQAALLLGLVAAGLAYTWVDHLSGWTGMASKALFAYLPHFACGMLVALWAESRRRRSAPDLSPAATVALVVGGFALAIGNSVWHTGVAVPTTDTLMGVLGDAPAAAGFALVVAAAVAGQGPATAWMRARPLAWVGLVSYGVYLWHVPLILFARANGLLPSGFAPALLVVLPVVIVVSAASWYLVERPLIERAGRRRVRRPSRGRQGRLEAQAAP